MILGDEENMNLAYLIIDDSQFILNGVMFQSTNPKLEKQFTRDPRDADKIVRKMFDQKRAYIFILIDVEMPEMSGIECL